MGRCPELSNLLHLGPCNGHKKSIKESYSVCSWVIRRFLIPDSAQVEWYIVCRKVEFFSLLAVLCGINFTMILYEQRIEKSTFKLNIVLCAFVPKIDDSTRDI